MTRKILIEIPGAGPVNCDECEQLNTFSLPFPHCDIFDVSGVGGDHNMPRPQACLDAERLAGEDHG